MAFVTTVLLLQCIPEADAKLGSFTLETMIGESDSIVIGFVRSVTADENGSIVATIKINKTLKGDTANELVISVDRSWTCDISEAKAGERILLFIFSDKKTGKNRISESGRGRMPIDSVDGKEYATFWREVIMPQGVEIIPGPEPMYKFIQRARLSDLLAYINKVTKKSPNPH